LGKSKDTRTVSRKNYESSVAEGYGGSFIDFMDLKKTGSRKDYLAAVDSGYEGKYHEWLFEMKKAGASQINVGTRAEEAALGKQKADVKSPGFWAEIESTLKKDDRKWRSSELAAEKAKQYNISYNEARSRIQRAMKIEEGDRQIRLKYKNVKYVPGVGWYVGDELIQSVPTGGTKAKFPTELGVSH